MKLELRHLSGSRAGEVESFDDSTEITVGRHPSSLVLFDPDRDRSVSGHHASIHYEQGRWILRDLGSSNGTFVGETRVTQQELHDGEVLQFGSQGPRVRVTFTDTMAEPVAPAAVPAEGRTVMMMLPHDSAAAAASPVASSPRRKKGGMGRALLIVSAVGVVLLIGFVALALVIRSNNIRKRRQARTAQTTTASTTPTTAPTTTTAAAEAPTATTSTVAAPSADTEALKQQIAATRQTMQSAQESIAKGDPNANEIADLKRQIAESQALMEQMTRQLQEKNDEIAAERQRAAAKPKVVYVPVAAPQPAASTQTVAQTSPPASTQVVETRPEPGVVPPPPTPAPVRTTRSTPSSRQPAVSNPPASVPVVSSAPAAPLYKTKSLKIKVSITSTPPEIPPANLPSGTDRGLVNLIGAALVSSGDYVVGPNGQLAVNVMVTNYKADAKGNVNTQGVSTSARKIGKIFGQKLPTNPVDVKNVTYDAAMSARIRLLDRAGRILLETEPSSASADRKAKVALAGVSFNDAVLSDTAVGDVTRKVVADAVDALRAGLGSQEWTTLVTGATKDKIVLGVGSSAHVEPGDVFELVNGQQRVLGRIRVTSVTDSGSEAMLITPLGKERLAMTTARYLGSENASTSIRRAPRTITTRAKTPVYSGPGTSFTQIRELKPGMRMNLQFTVGPWAKADDGSGAVWVPLANTTIGS